MGHRIWAIWAMGLFGVFGFSFFSFLPLEGNTVWDGMGSQPTGKKEATLTGPLIRNCLFVLMLLCLFF